MGDTRAHLLHNLILVLDVLGIASANRSSADDWPQSDRRPTVVRPAIDRSPIGDRS